MKDDPENNKTVYYGHQHIPNINEYMPQTLLRAMDSMDCLHYGDEPPRIEGEYIVDSTFSIGVIRAPGSNWSGAPSFLLGTRRFDFKEQHLGISKLEYIYYDDNADIVEKSNSDTTSKIMQEYLETMLFDTLFPGYFHNRENDFKVFDYAYIMGHDSYFTVYYYDVRSYLKVENQPYNIYKPLYANIISGRIESDPDTNETIIKDLMWGTQTVKYYEKDAINSMVYNYHAFPKEGDGRLIQSDYIQTIEQSEQ
jgi:hypothetical protein